MEMNRLTFVGPASRPVCCFSSNRLSQNLTFSSSIPTNTNSFCVPNSRGRRRSVSVKAEDVDGYVVRPSLSSEWDLSAAPAPFLPRFEELDITNVLLRQRIVFIGSQIDDTTADFVISQLLLLDAEDSKQDIKLFINSPGGSITAGMGIYDAMKQCRADVSTITFGLAASMGAFILAGGTKGKRFCMPNSKVMIHQPIGVVGGSATEMSIQLREMLYHKVKINKTLSRITGKPESQIDLDTDRDFFMNPWEAKEYGLVDAVIGDGQPGWIAPTADATPPPKTKIWKYWTGIEGRKDESDLPSEHRLLRKGGLKREQENEAPSSV